MGVDIYQWEQIVAAKVTGRALSAGYPDLLVEFHNAPIRPDSDAVQDLHNFKHPIADSVAVFRAMGLELEVIDRAVYQGCERVVDLNRQHCQHGEEQDFYGPLQLGEYDLVIDPGTSEHCFNIPQALVNLADAVKVGGVISQALPMAMFNHGYWNVNPVALIDFYELNGFAIERFVIRHEDGLFEPKLEERSMRMTGISEGAVNLILARRVERRTFRWPQQRS